MKLGTSITSLITTTMILLSSVCFWLCLIRLPTANGFHFQPQQKNSGRFMHHIHITTTRKSLYASYQYRQQKQQRSRYPILALKPWWEDDLPNILGR